MFPFVYINIMVPITEGTIMLFQKILFSSSDSEAEDVEELLQDVIRPLSTLRVDEDHHGKETCREWNCEKVVPSYIILS